jgi:hypothetical protein
MAWFKKKSPAEAVEQTSYEKGVAEMAEYEKREDVPRDPRDWPKGKATYVTYGNAGDDAYGEGATAKLGPAEVAHHEDGSVSVGGVKVDDPSKYKGKPITGGIIDQLTQHTDRNKKMREQEEQGEPTA